MRPASWKPLRPSASRGHVLMGRVLIDNVVVDDLSTAASSTADRSGRDAVQVVRTRSRSARACWTASRRPSTPSSSSNEFEKVSREVESAFTEKARVVAELFGTKVDEVFGAQDGHLAQALQRAFRRGLFGGCPAPAQAR